MERLDPSNSDGLIAQLQKVFRDVELYRRLLRYQGPDVQRMLDSFQRLLDTPELANSFRRSLIVATQRISKKSGLYPTCYELKGIVIEGQHPITAGGFADIFKGDFEGQAVCLKAIRIYRNREVEHFLKQFSKEAVLWGQLSHPNLLPIYGMYRFQHRVCLVSPWMSAGDINEYIRSNPGAVDVAEGLSYLHRNGIIHGDLKGSNILINGAGIACVADFGLSSVSDPEILAWTSHSSAASKGGSTRWQAPELFDMENDTAVRNTVASDVYAWACVCYETFTGDIPFVHILRDSTVMLQIKFGARPARPAELSPPWRDWGLSESTWSIMQDCWKEDSAQRPTIEHVISALKQQLSTDDRSGRDEGTLCATRFRKTMGGSLDMITVSALDGLLSNNDDPTIRPKNDTASEVDTADTDKDLDTNTRTFQVDNKIPEVNESYPKLEDSLPPLPPTLPSISPSVDVIASDGSLSLSRKRRLSEPHDWGASPVPEESIYDETMFDMFVPGYPPRRKSPPFSAHHTLSLDSTELQTLGSNDFAILPNSWDHLPPLLPPHNPLHHRPNDIPTSSSPSSPMHPLAHLLMPPYHSSSPPKLGPVHPLAHLMDQHTPTSTSSLGLTTMGLPMSSGPPAFGQLTHTSQSRRHIAFGEQEEDGLTDISKSDFLEVEKIFFQYLNKICSDLDATDAVGVPIHVFALKPTKMQHLRESRTYNSFRLRVDSFLLRFLDELAACRCLKGRLSLDFARRFLQQHNYIRQLHESGEELTFSGYRIFIIEAREDKPGDWEFRPFYSKIIGAPAPIAYPGFKWSWKPYVWDPRTPVSRFSRQPSYSSPSLPPWLSWNNGILSGIAPTPMGTENHMITVYASFVLNGRPQALEHTFQLTVSQLNPYIHSWTDKFAQDGDMSRAYFSAHNFTT